MTEKDASVEPVLCKFCGWTQPLHWRKENAPEHANRRQADYKYNLAQCPGFTKPRAPCSVVRLQPKTVPK